jgi:hypothetical protein
MSAFTVSDHPSQYGHSKGEARVLVATYHNAAYIWAKIRHGVTSPLARRLLLNYLHKDGGFKITDREFSGAVWGPDKMRDHPANISLNSPFRGKPVVLHQIGEFLTDLEIQLATSGGGEFSGTYHLLTYAHEGRTYGNFFLTFEVTVCANPDGSYVTTKGLVSARDRYDFNPTDYRSLVDENDVSTMREYSQKWGLDGFETWSDKYEFRGVGKTDGSGYVEITDPRYNPPGVLADEGQTSKS